MEVPKKSFNFKKFFLIVFCIFTLFLVISCIAYKVSAAELDTVSQEVEIFKLDSWQYGSIVSLLTIIAVSLVLNGVVMFTRKK